MGKAFQEALADVDDTAACFEYYAVQAEELDKRQWQKIAVPNQQFVSRVRYEPVGVCGAVIPFVRETWRGMLHLPSYFFQMHFLTYIAIKCSAELSAAHGGLEGCTLHCCGLHHGG
jgi:hypothetical protein